METSRPQLYIDDKVYSCDLNLYKDTFTISRDGEMICKSNQSLRGKTFIPFIMLHTGGNEVKLCGF